MGTPTDIAKAFLDAYTAKYAGASRRSEDARRAGTRRPASRDLARAPRRATAAAPPAPMFRRLGGAGARPHGTSLHAAAVLGSRCSNSSLLSRHPSPPLPLLPPPSLILRAAADANGLSQLYGDDSILSFDGQTVQGRAAIMQAMGPRMAGGPVNLRVARFDAQGTPAGSLVVFVTGDSSVPVRAGGCPGGLCGGGGGMGRPGSAIPVEGLLRLASHAAQLCFPTALHPPAQAGKFTAAFTLLPTPGGGMYIKNEVRGVGVPPAGAGSCACLWPPRMSALLHRPTHLNPAPHPLLCR